MNDRLTVHVGNDIVHRASDGYEVGYFFAGGYRGNDSGSGETWRHELQTIGLCSAIAFKINTESAAAAFNCAEPVTYGEFEHFGHFNAVFAFGNVVDELFDYAGALHHFVHTHFVACHRVAFCANNFLEVELRIDAVWVGLANVARPA